MTESRRAETAETATTTRVRARARAGRASGRRPARSPRLPLRTSGAWTSTGRSAASEGSLPGCDARAADTAWFTHPLLLRPNTCRRPSMLPYGDSEITSTQAIGESSRMPHENRKASSSAKHATADRMASLASSPEPTTTACGGRSKADTHASNTSQSPSCAERLPALGASTLIGWPDENSVADQMREFESNCPSSRRTDRYSRALSRIDRRSSVGRPPSSSGPASTRVIAIRPPGSGRANAVGLVTRPRRNRSSELCPNPNSDSSRSSALDTPADFARHW